MALRRTKGETELELIEARAELKRVQIEHDRLVRAASSALENERKGRLKAIKTTKAEYDSLTDPRGKKLGSYRGIKIYERWIETPHGSGSIIGALASVDSQMNSRFTMTRLALLGPLALGAKKNTGHLYLNVETPDLSSVVECPQDDQKRSREFCIHIRNVALSAARNADRLPQLVSDAAARLEVAQSEERVRAKEVELASTQEDPGYLASLEAITSELSRLEEVIAGQAAVAAADTAAQREAVAQARQAAKAEKIAERERNMRAKAETKQLRRSSRDEAANNDAGPAGLSAEAGLTPENAAAGWYADPWLAAPLRWWDGFSWSEHVHDPGLAEAELPRAESSIRIQRIDS